jgi:8-oxo-dGTP diphosphatase
LAAPASSVPRVRVAAVVVIGDEIALVRHRAGEHTYHLLPGGGVEAGETLGRALKREVEEETGLWVRPVRPLLISDTLSPDGERHIINITFLTEKTGGEVTRRPFDPRVEAVDLVTRDALSTLDLRPPIAEALAELWDGGFAGEARYLGPLWVEERP